MYVAVIIVGCVLMVVLMFSHKLGFTAVRGAQTLPIGITNISRSAEIIVWKKYSFHFYFFISNSAC